MRVWAMLFGAVIAAIIFLADTSRLGFLHAIYEIPWGDKVGHFMLYGVLSLLVNLSALEGKLPSQGGKSAAVWSLILGAAIGLEEFSQRWIPARTFGWSDLAASYTGVGFFAWMAVRIRARPESVR